MSEGTSTSATAAAAATKKEEEIWTLHCSICGKPADLRCSKCKGCFYCSPEHQKLGWKEHKVLCATKEPETCFKTLEAALDISAPLFVFGNIFDSIAVTVEATDGSNVDGRTVLICTTGKKLQKPVTALEFCANKPDLYYMAHTIQKGLEFALTFSLAICEVLSSTTANESKKVSLSYKGIPISAVGVVEKIRVTSNFTGLILVDSETGKAYSNNIASSKEHGLSFIRLINGNVIFIDFAAAQFGVKELHNESPLLVCDKQNDEKKMREIYGNNSIQDWNLIEGTPQIGDVLKRFLEENDNESRGNPQLAKQIRLGIRFLVSTIRKTFDLASPSKIK